MRLAEFHLTGGLEENKRLYNNKELEDDHGLYWYHYGARYYDPQVGRWWTVDPVDEFMSPYLYCANDPIKLIDPDGMAVYNYERGKLASIDWGSIWKPWTWWKMFNDYFTNDGHFMGRVIAAVEAKTVTPTILAFESGSWAHDLFGSQYIIPAQRSDAIESVGILEDPTFIVSYSYSVFSSARSLASSRQCANTMADDNLTSWNAFFKVNKIPVSQSNNVKNLYHNSISGLNRYCINYNTMKNITNSPKIYYFGNSMIQLPTIPHPSLYGIAGFATGAALEKLILE